ncbi:nucleotide-diphospho-sugar transferase [Cokeromyces recurvatus]|uniref:nucleotide-diphospho-sugar transferase n=1 Tax=Cokeromyces recurvatus TaxID=90255 RepID=UPI00221E4AAA|nr:nucleotide-diphospho-sugar transferase [Cokeromyces recurvatus]KAI7903857.1 nucleotide-diphospho-sugar transferase [Cokeromyces recurvatus]
MSLQYNINKKSGRLLFGLVLITLLVYFLQSKSFYNKATTTTIIPTTIENKQQDAITTEGGKRAFVTFLCDDVMGEATEVLVYSLKQTNTNHDIVVLVLDDVSELVRKRLVHLGAIIINVDQVKYPWDSSSARRKGFNKACRYSKLNLWNLTQYKKVVFLDADTMVVKNIDELFNYPQFTAAVDIGGVLNTGVFVAEPNKETYRNIMNTYETAPSYNKGDQGFLNYYFNQSANPLPGNYNLMIKFTHFSTLASSFVTKNTVKVLHFTSETKPWNFHFLHQREWRENYDGYLFGLWTRMLRKMKTQLNQVGLLETTDEMDWANKGRVTEICDHRLKANYGRRYPKTHQFTIILNRQEDTSDSLDQFETMLRDLSASKYVAQIFVNGGDKTKDQKVAFNTAYFRRLKLQKPVKAIPEGDYKSVNNKFNPIQGIVTDAVFIIDSNTLISIKDIEFGYQVWKKNMDSIVGFSPIMINDNQYNMIESKAMFMKSDYLYSYTCLLPETVHRYVDQNTECADTAMNMFVSGMTGISPVLVKSSSNHTLLIKNATQQTSSCIQGLLKSFNGKNTLISNNQIISPYT